MKYYKRIVPLSGTAQRIQLYSVPKEHIDFLEEKGISVVVYKNYAAIPEVAISYCTEKNTDFSKYLEISKNTFTKYLLSAQSIQRKIVGVDKKGKFRNYGNR